MRGTWVRWMAAMATVVSCVLLGGQRGALAGPSCKQRLATYKSWLGRIKADVAGGAVLSDRVDRLVAIPLHKGTAPDEPAMTLVVDRAGLHDGHGAARPAPEAAQLIAENRNIAWARSHANAIARGILVAGTRDALAADVHAAVAAAVAAHQPVWLMFRAGNARATAPPRSAVSRELEAAGEDINALVPIIQREFGRCSGLMAMMRKLGGQTTRSRLATLVKAPLPAMKACRCQSGPDAVASILWTLGFANLGVLVAVPPARAAALPWGDAKASWAQRAPLVVKSLR